MDARITTAQSHSADVRIHLAVDGRVYSVAQLGPDFVVLRDPHDHPPTTAQITMAIDDDLKCWSVELIDGIVVSQRKTRIVDQPPQLNGYTPK